MIILVTGASSGLGALCAERLAAEGHRVIAASRRGIAPNGCRGVVMDVDFDASVDAGVREVLAAEGGLDAVVLSAGWGLAGAVEDTSSADALAQLQTNFLGAHRVCRAALPALRERQGRVLFISSIAAQLPLPYQAFYCASKAALSSYAEALRLEQHPFGVRVTVVEPGNFNTGFTDARRRVSTPGSVYAARVEASVHWMEGDERKAPPATMLARAVSGLLSRASPPPRVVVTASLLERFGPLLRAILPARLYEYVALRLFKVVD